MNRRRFVRCIVCERRFVIVTLKDLPSSWTIYRNEQGLAVYFVCPCSWFGAADWSDSYQNALEVPS